MNWSQVLAVVTKACAEQGEERRVLLALADATYHVQEPLPGDAGAAGDLLGFVVYADDPDLSKRTDETCLLFVRPEQVLRVLVQGYDSSVDPFGFGA